MKSTLFLLLLFFMNARLHAQSARVEGRVVSARTGQPLAGVTITAGPYTYQTGEQGLFFFRDSLRYGKVRFTYSGYEPQTVLDTAQHLWTIRLEPREASLEEVTVSTGYQRLPKDRATGSFSLIREGTLQRTPSFSLLDRLAGNASGLLVDAGAGDGGFSIRGRSTLFAGSAPLIVVDQFPYDGPLSSLNPNDIESVTLLKDAAAASIWGVRAGNGVVVVTTKRGREGLTPQLSFSASLSLTPRPLLSRGTALSSASVMEAETALFEAGAYDLPLAYRTFYPFLYVSPVVAILDEAKRGVRSPSDAAAALEGLGATDRLKELEQEAYRPQTHQQYSLGLRGGTAVHRYAFSLGADRTAAHAIATRQERYTLALSQQWYLAHRKLEVHARINGSLENGSASLGGRYQTAGRRYEGLTGADGSSLAVGVYGTGWTDTVGGGLLKDWHLRPLDELRRADSKHASENLVVQMGLQYRPLTSLSLSANYQWSGGAGQNTILHPLTAFYTRDLLNTFSLLDYSSGTVVSPLPDGAIRDLSRTAYTAHQLRLQGNFERTWGVHAVTVLGGAEAKQYDYASATDRAYGYNEERSTVQPVDYTGTYPQGIGFGGAASVPFMQAEGHLADRYLSLFANAAYTYGNRFTLSGSARRDASNLFGVAANQRGVPLWSAGAAWTVSREGFYELKALPLLRLRVTTGYNGNVDKSVSAFTTAGPVAGPFPGAAPYAIVNPPNPGLRWEKIRLTNLGLDLEGAGGCWSATLDYYFKKGTDLLGYALLAPQTGATAFKGNYSNLKARGWDLTLQGTPLRGPLKVQLEGWLSHTYNKVTRYAARPTPLGLHEGRPFEGLYAYRWAGLDPVTGDPRGYLGGKESTAWGTLLATDSTGTVAYEGVGVPTYFGSFRPTLRFQGWALSATLSYKGGYVFRVPTISYSNLVSSLTAYYGLTSISGHADFDHRWRQPGDEAHTTVPSWAYPGEGARDDFYANADVNVAKGAHLRLTDVVLSWEQQGGAGKTVRSLRVYTSLRNGGLLWRANHQGLDPEALDLPLRPTYAAGLQLDF